MHPTSLNVYFNSQDTFRNGPLGLIDHNFGVQNVSDGVRNVKFEVYQRQIWGYLTITSGSRTYPLGFATSTE